MGDLRRWAADDMEERGECHPVQQSTLFTNREQVNALSLEALHRRIKLLEWQLKIHYDESRKRAYQL